MAAESLLAALQGNYGLGEPIEDDVNTVRGLLGFCKKWTDGLVHPAELNDPCLAMAARLKAGANDMEADLKANAEMAEEMRTPIKRTMEAYRAIADVLEEFPEFAKDDNIDDFLDNLEVFEEERQAVLDAQEQIQFQLSGKTALCPRCGSSGEAPDCETCLLARLYPDPAANRAKLQQARLPGLYGKVFKAYVRVISGKRSLPALWEALAPLEEHLDTLLSTRKQLAKRVASGKLNPRRKQEARAAEHMLMGAEPDVQLALKGVERMKAAEQSLRMSDLSRGWEDIFHAAQALELTAARIRRRLGAEDEQISPTENTADGVFFSGE